MTGRSVAKLATGDRLASNPSDKARRENMVILLWQLLPLREADEHCYTLRLSHLRNLSIRRCGDEAGTRSGVRLRSSDNKNKWGDARWARGESSSTS